MSRIEETAVMNADVKEADHPKEIQPQQQTNSQQETDNLAQDPSGKRDDRRTKKHRKLHAGADGQDRDGKMGRPKRRLRHRGLFPKHVQHATRPPGNPDGKTDQSTLRQRGAQQRIKYGEHGAKLHCELEERSFRRVPSHRSPQQRNPRDTRPGSSFASTHADCVSRVSTKAGKLLSEAAG